MDFGYGYPEPDETSLDSNEPPYTNDESFGGFSLETERIMVEYAIEKLEELKDGLPTDTTSAAPSCETYCTCDAREDIEAMQRSLKERLAKGGVE